jgi:hypothetical protein
MSTATAASHPWDRLQRGAFAVGIAGLLLWGAGGLLSPAHFFRAHLTAFNYWLGVALGCMFLLMIQHLTGGAWGVLLRRILEAGSRTLPLLAVFALPLLAAPRWLYPWADAARVNADEELQRKALYLNVPTFLVRLGVYFGVWLLIALFLTRWSAQQDAGRAGEERRFRLLSAPGMLLYGLTITFASIDWVMSLEPHWASTIYPAMFASGQALEGMAFAVIAFLLLSQYPPLSEVARPVHRRDLGNLLLTFVMVWAYLSFSQYLIIWAENMHEETPWYLRRLRDGWQWVALAIALFQFAMPFVFLLFRDVKEEPQRLLVVAGVVLAMRFVDVFWWVEAAFAGGVSWYWTLDVAALVGMGGMWLWWFLWQLGKQPLLPRHDPYIAEYLPEAVRHE